MSQTLRVSLVSLDIAWEDPKGNYTRIEELLKQEEQQTDLIILPEMFTTGFNMDADRISEAYRGKQTPSLVWMHQLAAKYDAAVVGSIAVREGDDCYNRLIWMPPNGQFDSYDKRHLFSFAGEDKHYTSGSERLIVAWRGWRICPLVCYDLRFPVWGRNALVEGRATYDLLLYVANWPSPRYKAWEALLCARAIENVSYVAGVNRVGQDANGHAYLGGSMMYDFRGGQIPSPDASKEGVLFYELDLDTQKGFRSSFPALSDADPFILLDN